MDYNIVKAYYQLVLLKMNKFHLTHETVSIYETRILFENKKGLEITIHYVISRLLFGHKKAADENRTRDLRLTKATLYRLSHSSLSAYICKTRMLLYQNSWNLSTETSFFYRLFHR